MAYTKNKLYVSGNYAIVEKIGGLDPDEFGLATSYYNSINGGYMIRDKNTSVKLTILTADIGDWDDEAGTTAYDATTLLAFLRANFSYAGDSSAKTTTDTTNFDGILSSADDTVQKALETLDDLAIGLAELKNELKATHQQGIDTEVNISNGVHFECTKQTADKTMTFINPVENKMIKMTVNLDSNALTLTGIDVTELDLDGGDTWETFIIEWTKVGGVLKPKALNHAVWA